MTQDPFASTFLVVFIAELADKSRLAGVMLASTYRAPWSVFLGMTLAYALLDGAAAAAGGALPGLVPKRGLALGAGALFIVFGVAALWLAEEAEQGARRWLERVKHLGPFTVSFLAIALAELGDRTQLATAALAAESGRPWAVFGGALAALTVLNALTVRLGEALSRRLPLPLLQRAGGLVFLALGGAMLWSGLRG